MASTAAPPTRASACRTGREPSRALTGVPPARVADQGDREPPAVGAPRLRPRLQPADADVDGRRLVRAADDQRQAHVGRRDGGSLEIGEQGDLARSRLGGEDLAREPEGVAQVEPPGGHGERAHLIQQRLPVAPARNAVRGQQPERVLRRRPPEHLPGRRLQLGQPRRSRHHHSAARRIVHHQHQRAGRVAGHPAPRQGRPGRGEHEGDDQKSAEEQKEEVLELEPALVLAGRRDEVADRREDDGGRLPASQQVEQNGNRGGGESRQRPRVQKTDHAARDDGASASRSTMP